MSNPELWSSSPSPSPSSSPDRILLNRPELPFPDFVVVTSHEPSSPDRILLNRHERSSSSDSIPPTINVTTVGRLANLAQLLPNNAVFAFQTLSPSFTNRGAGKCYPVNMVLTISLIIFSALSCFLFAFIDSFKHPKTGKSYFGIATPRGFHILNMSPKEKQEMDDEDRIELDRELRIHWIDWIHAFFSIAVFAAFAISDAYVVDCLFPNPGEDLKAFFRNVPFVLTFLASIIFFVFPTSRRGFGKYSAKTLREESNTNTLYHPQTSKHKTTQEYVPMGRVASLAQLLPSNTVFAFQTLVPLFTNSGTDKCYTTNKCLTISLIVFCAVLCFGFSFTDTIKDPDTGKINFGIATFNGLCVINTTPKEKKEIEGKINHDEFKIRGTDWIHALVSFAVFGAFGISDGDVVKCLFPKRGPNLNQLFINLPLALASVASLIFFIIPTSRLEIGYGHATSGNILGDKGDYNYATAAPKGFSLNKYSKETAKSYSPSRLNCSRGLKKFMDRSVRTWQSESIPLSV